jgi:hypothetical protein
MLDDVLIQWCGQYVLLLLNGKTLAMFSTDQQNLVGKIELWLDKNHYRCSQIQNGKIMI